MKVQKAELAQKIRRIKSVVPKRAVMDVLQNILVEDGYLIANNLELAVKAKIPASEGERFLIPMRAFDLIDNLPDGLVEITAKDGSITIKTGSIENRYVTADPDDFPRTEVPEGEKIVMNCQDMLNSMKRVSYAISTQGGNHLMDSMSLKAGAGYLNFAGLDGKVAAWDKIQYGGELELLIPKSTVEKILGLGLTGDVTIYHTNLGALFCTEEYEVYTRLMNGEYFEYQRMFRDMPLRTSVVRMSLLEALNRTRICVEGNSPVVLDIHEDRMDISISDAGTDYREKVWLLEPLGSDLRIGFDPRHIIDTLKAFDCDNIGILLANAVSPMIVEAEDSDFRAMVMPVRLK